MEMQSVYQGQLNALIMVKFNHKSNDYGNYSNLLLYEMFMKFVVALTISLSLVFTVSSVLFICIGLPQYRDCIKADQG